MMSALPQTVPTLPPMFAGLIPAMPAGASEEGGFDQLIAVQASAPAAATTNGVRVAAPVANSVALPVVADTSVAATPAAMRFAPAVAADLAAPITTISGEAPATAPAAKRAIDLPLAAKPALPQQPVAENPAEPAKPVADRTPAAKPETAVADNGIATASWLLGTAGRFAVPTANTQPGKAPVATKDGEGEASADAAPSEGKDAAPVIVLPATVAPVDGKPALDAAPKPAAERNNASALPMAAPKARAASAPLPGIALAAAEPVAKPAAEASMTVLFAQPAAPAGVAEAARPAIVAERTLDLASDDAWIDQLASDIAATKSAAGDISFRLMPRHLGRLDVSMLMGDEGVSLKLDTQHESTATIVTAAQVRLVDDLRQQGVRVADAQVTCTPNDTGRQSQGQGRTPMQDAAHLIETATDRAARAETRDQEQSAGDRRGRFA